MVFTKFSRGSQCSRRLPFHIINKLPPLFGGLAVNTLQLTLVFAKKFVSPCNCVSFIKVNVTKNTFVDVIIRNIPRFHLIVHLLIIIVQFLESLKLFRINIREGSFWYYIVKPIIQRRPNRIFKIISFLLKILDTKYFAKINFIILHISGQSSGDSNLELRHNLVGLLIVILNGEIASLARQIIEFCNRFRTCFGATDDFQHCLSIFQRYLSVISDITECRSINPVHELTQHILLIFVEFIVIVFSFKRCLKHLSQT